jgi:hypothetical protein
LNFIMSNNRGIFDSFPNQPQNQPDSPFAVAPESGEQAAKDSPFTAVAQQDSPFTVVAEAGGVKAGGFEKPVKLPERRKLDSPFQMADPSEGFGFEAPAKAPAASSSPFSAPPEKSPASPFSVEPQKTASPSTQAAIAAFTDWQEPAAQTPSPFSAVAEPAPAQIPSAFAAAPEPQTPVAAPAPQPQATPAPAPQAEAPAAQQAAPAPSPQPQDAQSDSFNIRQLELRAIFGVDREMTVDEILKRSRALPGMRNIARLTPQDMASLDAVKNLLPNLGFGSGTLKLYSGSVPLEFIREGSTMLAVQTDGGFAPGVRETLMIVARELDKIA